MGIIQLVGGGELSAIAYGFLGLLRLVMFALALGLTVISYQAYSDRGTKRLESAFIGFAFVSMGMGVSALNSQVMVGAQIQTGSLLIALFQIVETIPFILGFAMLYLSLYR